MSRTKNILYTVFFLLFIVSAYGQSTSAEEDKKGKGLRIFFHPQKFYRKYFPDIKIKKPDVDSLYIKSYPNLFTTGAHLISPSISLNLYSKSNAINASEATSKFRTNIGNILAFSGSYRYIAAGFAVVLSSNNKGSNYTETRYRTATIKYNGSAYSLQFKYARTKGFTDINGYNSVNNNNQYTNRDDLLEREYQFEGIYNFSWKKYSYYAPLDYTQRQLKTRMGFLIKAGVYYNQLSGDSNLLTVAQRPYFEDFNNIKTIRSTSFKIAPGLGINLVFLRRFYLSASIFVPYNLYFYKYLNEDDIKSSEGASIAKVLDGSAVLGYQSKRFYAGLRYQFYSKQADFKSVGMKSLFSYFSIDLGYRFKAPKILKRIYKKTMPPGM